MSIRSKFNEDEIRNLDKENICIMYPLMKILCNILIRSFDVLQH